MKNLQLTFSDLGYILHALDTFAFLAKYRMELFNSIPSKEDENVNVLRSYWRDEYENVKVLINKLKYEK